MTMGKIQSKIGGGSARKLDTSLIWSHECEWTSGMDAEADLHKHFSNCQKNPGHASFIPIGQFSVDHLPPEYRNEDIVDWTKLGGDLTVRLLVHSTSMMRPEKFPDTFMGKDYLGYGDKVGCPYPFSDRKGTTLTRTGTGWVRRVHRYKGQCKCRKGCPFQDGARIFLRTACHVVFDDTEAENTEVWFFYDSEDEKTKRMKKEWGGGMADSGIEGDWSEIWFVSHDPELLDSVQKALRRRELLAEELFNKYVKKTTLIPTPDSAKKTGSESEAVVRFPVIITSHPHGCSKMVTIGKCTEVHALEKRLRFGDKTVRFYTTDTCPGSSGAPIWRVWQRSGFSNAHSHSGALPGAINRSGAGLF